VRESAIEFVHFGDLGWMKDALAGLCSVSPHWGIVMEWSNNMIADSSRRCFRNMPCRSSWTIVVVKESAASSEVAGSGSSYTTCTILGQTVTVVQIAGTQKTRI